MSITYSKLVLREPGSKRLFLMPGGRLWRRADGRLAGLPVRRGRLRPCCDTAVALAHLRLFLLPGAGVRAAQQRRDGVGDLLLGRLAAEAAAGVVPGELPEGYERRRRAPGSGLAR
jgi:hypothetical protein